MEGDTTHGDQVDKTLNHLSRRQPVESVASTTSSKKSTLSLRFEITPRPGVGANRTSSTIASSAGDFAAPSFPVSVAVEYDPDEVNVDVRATICRSAPENVVQRPLDLQLLENINSASPVPSSLPPLVRERDTDDEQGGDGDGEDNNTLYQTVLMGNDSLISHTGCTLANAQFGDLSAIRPLEQNIMQVTKGQGQSQSEGSDEDEGDGLYPPLTETEEGAQFKEMLELLDDIEEDKEQEQTGSMGFDVNKMGKEFYSLNERQSKSYDVTNTEEEMKILVDDLLERLSFEEDEVRAEAEAQAELEASKKQKKLVHGQQTPLPTQKPGWIMPKVKNLVKTSGFVTELPMKENLTSFKLSMSLPVKKDEENVRYKFHSQQRIAEDKRERNSAKRPLQVVAEDKIKETEMAQLGLGSGSSSLTTEGNNLTTCAHAKGYCSICLPLPEAAVYRMEQAVGISTREARIVALELINYLKDNQGQPQVQQLMKFVTSNVYKPNSGSTFSTTASSGLGVNNVNVGGGDKESKLSSLLATTGRHNGAWGIFEMEDYVISYFSALSQLLTLMDGGAVRHVLKALAYRPLKNLALYFGLEKRWAIKGELLGVLELLIMKDGAAAGVLIGSDFPVDCAAAIVREYMENGEEAQDRIIALAALFCTLLRSGYWLQPDHLDRFDVNFPYVLLQLTEGNLAGGVMDEARDAGVGLLLALNMHYPSEEMYSNRVLPAFSGLAQDADYFKTKLLNLILNQHCGQFGSRQVRMPSPWINMIVKFATDILECVQTSAFFLENDLAILLEGLNLYVPELERGDEKRTKALKLMRLIMRRINHKHPGLRRIIAMLKGIMSEKENESRSDQRVVRKIAKEIEESRLSTTF